MISKHIQARFLPQFVPAARARLLRCRAALAVDASMIAYELHALSGEAATLGLTQLAAQARACEDALRQGREPASEAAWLDRMEADLAALLPAPEA